MKKYYIFATQITNTMYISIITGDIVNSKKVNPQLWLPALKDVLHKFGKEPEQWEVFRGDSFQLEVKAENALEAALLIKSAIKEINGLDVRMAIGIGEKTYSTTKITESNGSAFVNSGECFDGLKKQKLEVKSPWEFFDIEVNLFLELLSNLVLDKWTPTSASMIKEMLQNAEFTQSDLALKLSKPQSNISVGLRRAGFEELKNVVKTYQLMLKRQC